ncbi:MAG: N-acetyl-gamma-glutamyl-phosphate reductase [Verrucomicrobiales bacterium]|nr:N-acetyl-gamma-glutamyl-phosphate reductase [Verrucomicrobiales bacterium]
MSEKKKVLVVGASGYSGQELLRFLLMHPVAELSGVTSRANAGTALAEVFPRFRGHAVADGLRFMMPEVEAIVATGAEFVFLALPHGLASEFALPLLEKGLRVIDLSADFRLSDAAVYEEFYGEVHPAPELLAEAVYGLPEVYGEAVKGARIVASPGCYPTSVLVPLIPLLKAGLLDPATICVASMSGVSGAGKTAKVPFLFAECNESVRAYSVPKHRHLSEIEQELSLAAGETLRITFVPHLMPVTTGICTTIFAAVRDGVDAAAMGAVLEGAYGGAKFVRLLGENGCADTKNVKGTNRIDGGWALDGRTGRAVLSSAEDNLGKGAATQAVQSFNLMAGLAEETGLGIF